MLYANAQQQQAHQRTECRCVARHTRSILPQVVAPQTCRHNLDLWQTAACCRPQHGVRAVQYSTVKLMKQQSHGVLGLCQQLCNIALQGCATGRFALRQAQWPSSVCA